MDGWKMVNARTAAATILESQHSGPAESTSDSRPIENQEKCLVLHQCTAPTQGHLRYTVIVRTCLYQHSTLLTDIYSGQARQHMREVVRR